MNLYLVVFDVSNHRERTKIGKVLLKYGQRKQRSVFEIVLETLQQRQTLIADLRAVTSELEGVRFYRVCERCRAQSFSLDGDSVEVMPDTLVI